mgnify:CR=1 FL=1
MNGGFGAPGNLPLLQDTLTELWGRAKARADSGVACLTLAAPLQAQDFATAFDATEIAPGIHMLTGAEGKFGGGNMSVLVGDEQVVLIDDAMVPTAQPVLDAVNRLAGRAPDFVINTHIHGDHVGGNALMQDNGSYVVAHDNIRKRLAADSKDAGGDGGLPMVAASGVEGIESLRIPLADQPGSKRNFSVRLHFAEALQGGANDAVARDQHVEHDDVVDEAYERRGVFSINAL